MPPGPAPDPPATLSTLSGCGALELADQLDVIAAALTRISDVWSAGAPPTAEELLLIAGRLETVHQSLTGRPVAPCPMS